MSINKTINVLGALSVLLVGLLLGSYYPLPGTPLSKNTLKCPEQIECPTGFATLDEMAILVGQLENCTSLKMENKK